MISCRSTAGFLAEWMAQPVVAGAIGRRLDRQRQGRWGRHRPGRVAFASPGQDVEHHVAAAQLGRQRLGAGRPDGVDPGLGDRRQDVDELAIAVVMAGEATANLRQTGGRSQLRNGSPLRSAPGFRASTGR